GDRFLIEINGRYWGSLQLAVDAGVDFPYLSCQLALGSRPDVPPGYRLGVKNRWLLGDLDHLLSRLSSTRGELFLAEEAPSRGRALLEFLECTRPGVLDQIARGDDPRTVLFELLEYVRNLYSSAVPGVRRRLLRGRGRMLRFARPSI